MTVPEGAGPGPKKVASPPKRVQDKMLRTSRESLDSDEELEYAQACLARARMDPPIRIAKVEMPCIDAKSDFGIKFVSRNMNLIVYSDGQHEPIEHGVAKSLCSHTACRERAAAIMASEEYHVLSIG